MIGYCFYLIQDRRDQERLAEEELLIDLQRFSVCRKLKKQRSQEGATLLVYQIEFSVDIRQQCVAYFEHVPCRVFELFVIETGRILVTLVVSIVTARECVKAAQLQPPGAHLSVSDVDEKATDVRTDHGYAEKVVLEYADDAHLHMLPGGVVVAEPVHCVVAGADEVRAGQGERPQVGFDLFQGT